MHVAQAACANGLTGGRTVRSSCWRHDLLREVTFRPPRYLRLSCSPASRPRRSGSEGPSQPRKSGAMAKCFHAPSPASGGVIRCRTGRMVFAEESVLIPKEQEAAEMPPAKAATRIPSESRLGQNLTGSALFVDSWEQLQRPGSPQHRLTDIR